MSLGIGVIGSLPTIFRQFDPLTNFNFQQLIYNWEAIGVFDLFLPFLLVFAVVFAILTSTKVLGDHRGVNVIIALVLGLFTIRFGFVTDFFSVIFANFGIAIAGLVVLLILTGLLVSEDNRKVWIKAIFGIALVGAIVVIIATINQFSWFGSYWWQENWTTIIWLVIGLFAIGGLIGWSKPKPDDNGPWKKLFGAVRDATSGH